MATKLTKIIQQWFFNYNNWQFITYIERLENLGKIEKTVCNFESTAMRL